MLRFGHSLTLGLVVTLATCTGYCGVAIGKVLRVTPPAGHVVQDGGPPDRHSDEALAVPSTLEKDAGCMVLFKKLPVPFTQDKLNARTDSPAFAKAITQSWQMLSDTIATEHVEQQGVHGFTARAETTDGSSLFATIFVTPQGETVVSCGGPTPRFNELLPEFRAIIHGVTLPL